MRRFLVLLAVMLAFVLSTAAVTAQDSTPAAEEEGASFEIIGAGDTGALPQEGAALVVFRISIEPGGFFPLDPEDPSVGLASIEAGAITVSADVPITVLHLPEDGEPGPEDLEQFAADVEFTMEERDSAIFPPNVGGEVRNDGEEDASILVTSIVPSEGDEEDEATPST